MLMHGTWYEVVRVNAKREHPGHDQRWSDRPCDRQRCDGMDPQMTGSVVTACGGVLNSIDGAVSMNSQAMIRCPARS